MNDKSLFRFEFINTIFITIMGFLLHFAFSWSNNNLGIGSFSAINESIWEHLKLLFFPSLITILVGSYYLKEKYPNYLSVKTKALIISLFFIVTTYYTYSGIIGTHFPIIDISIFIIGVVIEELITYKKVNKKSLSWRLYFFLLILFTFIFVYFTYNPPRINIFKDPITDAYGIKK